MDKGPQHVTGVVRDCDGATVAATCGQNDWHTQAGRPAKRWPDRQHAGHNWHDGTSQRQVEARRESCSLKFAGIKVSCIPPRDTAVQIGNPLP